MLTPREAAEDMPRGFRLDHDAAATGRPWGWSILRHSEARTGFASAEAAMRDAWEYVYDNTP